MKLPNSGVRNGFFLGLAVGLIVAVVAGIVAFERGRAVGGLIASATPGVSPSSAASPAQPSPSASGAPIVCPTASSPEPLGPSAAAPSSSSPSTSPSPSARGYASIAYDALRGQLVLFGGVGPAGYLRDTWLWDGGSWTEKHPLHAPSAREMAGMTWDPDLGQVVMFGGIAAGGVALNDTWSWNGSDWAPLFPAHCPSPRAPSAVAFDDVHHQVDVFGERTTTRNVVDTWLWNGTDWSLLAGVDPAANTSYSATIGMAWDPIAKSVTLVDFRSQSGGGVTYWRLGTEGWGSAIRIQIGMWGDSNLAAYDPGRNLWLFYGSQSAMVNPGVAVFDGATVTERQLSIHPTAMNDSIAAAYDPGLKAIVLFGGNGLQGPTAELWAWDFQQFSVLSG